METDIKGVVADAVIKVKPKQDLWVNNQRLQKGVVYTVPSTFDLVVHCEVVPEPKEELMQAPELEDDDAVEKDNKKAKKGKKES